MLYDLMSLVGYGLGLFLLVAGLMFGMLPVAALGAGVLLFALLSDGAIAQNPSTPETQDSQIQSRLQSPQGGSPILSLILMLAAIGALLAVIVAIIGL